MYPSMMTKLLKQLINDDRTAEATHQYLYTECNNVYGTEGEETCKQLLVL